MELLIGTNVLSRLGFSLQAKSADGNTADLLMTAAGELPRERGTTVRLLQTVKLPPQHKKVVRAQVDSLDNLSLLSLFEPEGYLL